MFPVLEENCSGARPDGGIYDIRSFGGSGCASKYALLADTHILAADGIIRGAQRKIDVYSSSLCVIII